MGLLSSMIVTVCMGSDGTSQSACSYALDASARQIGITQNMSEFEQRNLRIVDELAEHQLGKNGKSIASGMIFIIKSAADRQIIIPIPTGGIADNIQSHFRADSAVISFKWSF